MKREAEAAGLDRVFRDAGFFWGESGCSMCAGGNGDRGEPGERCVSTTNRNFEHRQGPKVRTHLVSPATAAATAIAGRIADVRQICGASLMQPFTQPHRHRRPADRGRHQHRPDRAGAGDARDQAGLQEAAVHARARATRQRDPDFVLNKPQFSNPGILVTGHNFGAGSSREAAVWGMLANNIRVIVAQELRRHLSRELPAERLAAGRAGAGRRRRLHRARRGGEWRGAVHGRSAERRRISGPGGPDIAFDIPAADRMRLLEGLDDIGLTLKHTDEIVGVGKAHGG